MRFMKYQNGCARRPCSWRTGSSGKPCTSRCPHLTSRSAQTAHDLVLRLPRRQVCRLLPIAVATERRPANIRRGGGGGAGTRGPRTFGSGARRARHGRGTEQAHRQNRRRQRPLRRTHVLLLGKSDRVATTPLHLPLLVESANHTTALWTTPLATPHPTCGGRNHTQKTAGPEPLPPRPSGILQVLYHTRTPVRVVLRAPVPERAAPAGGAVNARGQVHARYPARGRRWCSRSVSRSEAPTTPFSTAAGVT